VSDLNPKELSFGLGVVFVSHSFLFLFHFGDGIVDGMTPLFVPPLFFQWTSSSFSQRQQMPLFCCSGCVSPQVNDDRHIKDGNKDNLVFGILNGRVAFESVERHDFSYSVTKAVRPDIERAVADDLLHGLQRQIASSGRKSLLAQAREQNKYRIPPFDILIVALLLSFPLRFLSVPRVMEGGQRRQRVVKCCSQYLQRLSHARRVLHHKHSVATLL